MNVFPHWLSWLINNPVRRLILSPKGLADRLELQPTHRVLEIGPGSGFLSLELARRVPQGELVLLDVQPEMLAKARRRLEAAGMDNVRYVQADAGNTPDATTAIAEALGGPFDVILLVCVLGEVSDPQSCLRSCRHRIEPAGLLAIHESLPDPDMIGCQRLQTMVEPEGFQYHHRIGSAWNYTALFRPTE